MLDPCDSKHLPAITKMANSNEKYKEGMQHIHEAEKALKTGFFKWKEDFDTAADRYAKAALCFKLANSLDRCQSAYIKAADANVKNHCLFHGAKNLTQAASIAMELESVDEAIDLMEQAARLFREHGTPDSAASTYVKASKMCENMRPDKAVELLNLAADLCEVDEKFRDASKYLNSAVRIQLKNKKFFEACDTLNKFIELNKEFGNFPQSYKGVLILVIIYLTVDDSVAADRTVKTAFNYEGFVSSEEAETCEKLIAAFDDGDEDELKRLSKLAIISMQDVEVAKLGRALKPSEMNLNTINKGTGTLTLESVGVEEENIPVATESTKESEVSNLVQRSDYDDLEDDLC